MFTIMPLDNPNKTLYDTYRIVTWLTNELVINDKEQINPQVIATALCPNRSVKKTANGPLNRMKAIVMDPALAENIDNKR